ncbi:MAG: hypothetical protein KatS3mg105_3812 [Gemmatales bacterium]|nr:MAG: hypothetical protein KatS3mg105_3812 [Gemmatales bacterium]
MPQKALGFACQQEYGLLQAIIEDPDDDMPRLIYADWLEERGDARGEFIRVQCSLARLSGDDPEISSLRQREQELHDEYADTWRRRLPPPLRSQRFVRGFVETAQLDFESFLRYHDVISQTSPIRTLNLSPPDDVFATNVLPYATQIGRCCFPKSLRKLKLHGWYLGDSELTVLLTGENFPDHLETLSLRRNVIHDRGAAALANCSRLRSLRVLDLVGNQITWLGAEAMLRSKSLAGVRSFCLDRNLLSMREINEIRERFGRVDFGISGMI